MGKSHTASYGGEESKLGGENRKKGREEGENGRGRYPVSIFFFFSFSFGWLRFNQFHLMAEKKWRYGSEGGIVEFSLFL